MNHYTQLLIYIKSLADADVFINTVLKGGDFDLNKMDLYPVLNIDILTGGFTNGSTVLLDVEITCLDIRDENKNEVTADKFWDQDNEVDNHNETLEVLNRLWLKMYVDFADNDITSSENPTFAKMTGVEKNRLDGWLLSFSVEMPNTTIDLCNE